MLKEGINIVSTFENEEYYCCNLESLPVQSSIIIIDAFHFDHSNDLYIITRSADVTWKVTKFILFLSSTNSDFANTIDEYNQYENDVLQVDFSDRVSITKSYADSSMTVQNVIKHIDALCYKLTSHYELSKLKRLNTYFQEKINDVLPVYERAMNKVLLELESMIKELGKEKCEIVTVQSRVKDYSSIEEKIFRKNVSPYVMFNKFEDFAGVRIVCQYISDVYSLLEYMRSNELLSIIDVEDKITEPTEEGYRGIHVITSTNVFYAGKIHSDVKVEIQLRTSFQDAWSMKTHTLTYKKDNFEASKTTEKMKELSELLNIADQTAQELKEIAIVSKIMV